MPQAVAPALAAVAANQLSSSGGSGRSQGASVSSGNPAFPLLRELFGVDFFGTTLQPVPGKFPGIFEGLGPSIQDFAFNPLGLTGTEDALFSSILDNPVLQQQRLAQAQGTLGELQPFADEAARTGFRTDATPIFEEAIRRINTDVLPQLAETVGSRSGIQSAGLGAASTRESANLLGQASLADIQLREAAADRRLRGIPLSANLAGNQLTLPLAFTQDISNLAGQRRGLLESNRARPLGVFSQLAGLGQGQQFLQQGFNPVSSTATNLGTLASFFGGGGQSNPFRGIL